MLKNNKWKTQSNWDDYYKLIQVFSCTKCWYEPEFLIQIYLWFYI